jgi:hypothetical protein
MYTLSLLLLSFFFSNGSSRHSRPWPFIQFRNNFSQTVGLLERVISPSQGLYLNTGQHKHRINAYTHQISMPWAGFESAIPASGRAKTVHGLDRAATVTNSTQNNHTRLTENFECDTQSLPSPRRYSSGWALTFWTICLHSFEADSLVFAQFSFYGVTLLASRPTLNLEDKGIPLRLVSIPSPVRHVWLYQ